MGEFAIYRGEEIKIGTCEDMMYLRADQRHLVSGYTFDPTDRFRFPFPDEDSVEPGQFAASDRGVEIPGNYTLLAGEFGDHGSVQFSSHNGYLTMLPCPEQFGREHVELGGHDNEPSFTLKVMRNGFNAYPKVTAQREVDGLLCTIVTCGACRSSWRLPTLDEARTVIDAFRTEADEQDRREQYGQQGVERSGSSAFMRTIADRIEAGYLVAV